MSEKSTGNILELVAQLASLQRTLTPSLPAISQKLISNLLQTDVTPRRLAKVIQRSPSYVLAISRGQKSLTAQGIVDVMTFAANSVKAELRKAEADASQD